MSRLDHRLAAIGVVLGLVAVTPTNGGAQSLGAIPMHSRVRVDLPTTERSRFHRDRGQSVVGTLEDVRDDTVLLAVHPGAIALRIPRAAVRNLYVSGGHPSRWRAALDAALFPALITAAVTAAGTSINRKDSGPSPAQAAASSAAWAGASAALLGAWSPRERWHPISLQDSIARQASSTRDR
jgi:hypothetical protein